MVFSGWIAEIFADVIIMILNRLFRSDCSDYVKQEGFESFTVKVTSSLLATK